jgi:protein-tyrosine-phosphatase
MGAALLQQLAGGGRIDVQSAGTLGQVARSTTPSRRRCARSASSLIAELAPQS